MEDPDKITQIQSSDFYLFIFFAGCRWHLQKFLQCHLILDKGTQTYNGKKASSTNIAGKTGYLHVRN
jgi:hypothetical protein